MGRHKKTAVVLFDCGFVSLMSATTIAVMRRLWRNSSGMRARSPAPAHPRTQNRAFFIRTADCKKTQFFNSQGGINQFSDSFPQKKECVYKNILI